MKKTFVTMLPDESGAFLKVSECFYNLKINITRVSYNKSVDTHTLFIETEGDANQLSKAEHELEKLGFIAGKDDSSTVMLVEFKLDDLTGDLVKLLKIISEYNFNISYINSYETDSWLQNFKMAIYVDNLQKFNEFLEEAKLFTPVNVIDYDQTEVNYDNSIFYRSYAFNLAKNAGLNKNLTAKLAINVNRAMQFLDEKKVSPKETFDIIQKFAHHITNYKGKEFYKKTRITEYNITKNSTIYLIEPPCGSNTAIIKSFDEYLFVDSGYAVYKKEMIKIFDKIVGSFKSIKKRIVVTHADLDHCGLLPLFDEILSSDKSKRCFELEIMKKRGFREQNPLHLPYVRICKLLTFYKNPPLEKINVIANSEDNNMQPIYKVNEFKFGEFNFDVYLGQGGHIPGEMILIDKENKIVFSGDLYINMKNYTEEQKVYNKYAPILMTSVDSNVELAKIERNFLLKILGEDEYKIFGGHGGVKILNENC